jgi:hypothetical protein
MWALRYENSRTRARARRITRRKMAMRLRVRCFLRDLKGFSTAAKNLFKAPPQQH